MMVRIMVPLPSVWCGFDGVRFDISTQCRQIKNDIKKYFIRSGRMAMADAIG